MLLATPAASRRGKGKKSKGRKGREPAAPEEPDLDQWKAQVEAEGAPTVKLLSKWRRDVCDESCLAEPAD